MEYLFLVIVFLFIVFIIIMRYEKKIELLNKSLQSIKEDINELKEFHTKKSHFN